MQQSVLQVGALIEKWYPCSKEDRDTMRASALCAAMSLTHPEKPRLSGKTTAAVVVDDHENVADFLCLSTCFFCSYISLRLDGRVRGSGVGIPSWRAMSLQLPPLKGMWGGALDGMDGRV
jgi:hypothetical protein